MWRSNRSETSLSISTSSGRSPRTAIRSCTFSSPTAATNSRTAPSASLCADRNNRRRSRSASRSSGPVSVSSVSSPAASRRCTIFASQPLRRANAPRNSLMLGSTARSRSTSTRERRGAVISRKSVMRMATRPPAVMPFCSKPPATPERNPGEYHVVLAARADPERNPGHQPLAMVDAALHDLGHAAQRRRLVRRLVHAAEDDRQHGDGYQHVHRADDGRRQEPPEQGEPRGEHDRQQRRRGDQRAQQCRPSLGQRCGAEADERLPPGPWRGRSRLRCGRREPSAAPCRRR